MPCAKRRRTFYLAIYQLHSAGDLTGTEASGADVHVSGSPIHNRLHALHVGLPGTIGAAVRVGNLNAEHDALVTKFTFSHSLEPPRWFMTPRREKSPLRVLLLKKHRLV